MTAYLFTVENVLTNNTQRIDETFKEAFLNWQKTHDVYLISAESKEKIIEMVGIEIYTNSKIVFANYANEIWKDGNLLHRTTWDPEKELLDASVEITAGVGEIAVDSDPISFILKMSSKFPDVDFVLKNDNKVVFYPTGKDKRQALEWIKDDHIVLFGHKTLPGGDDYPLAVSVGLVHRIGNWQHTLELLEFIT